MFASIVRVFLVHLHQTIFTGQVSELVGQTVGAAVDFIDINVTGEDIYLLTSVHISKE